ncbi:MAG: sulfatase-like hydrolase/transferase [Verrucomicrobiota bacterium]
MATSFPVRVAHLFASVAIACSALTSRAESPQPNILFIFADDWGWGDLSCHGHPYVKTPNIDRLAAEGTDFQRFTVASGVCSPSRTAVMTGHFPARYAIDGHFAWVPSNARRGMPDWLDPEAPLLPRMLQSAGYRTAHFGKWHLANDMIPDSPSPGIYGYDAYGAFNCSGEQMPWYEDSARAADFIRESNAAEKPFFINLWIHEPHTPFHTVPKYEWRFRHLENREDQIYASVLSHADDRIGELLGLLDELELTENTLVIFSSDNGPARASKPTELALQYDTATGAGWGIAGAKGITGGRRGYKAAIFEGGIGVPFLARWPGKIPAGAVDEHALISAVDLLPTFCEIAGADLPDVYAPDGQSVIDVLTGDRSLERREQPLFWKSNSAWPAPKDRPDHWVSWAVLKDQWKLVANRDLDHFELFDITDDVAEATDLSKDNPTVVGDLLETLREWQATLPERPSGDVFSSERDDL